MTQSKFRFEYLKIGVTLQNVVAVEARLQGFR